MAEPTDYDTVAERYAAEIDHRPWNALYERPATLALLPDVHGKDVLDAGCGHGWYCQQLLERGARVIGVDRSARMAGLATVRVGSRARIIHGDVSDLRDVLADATFDIVQSSLMLHYVADLGKAFNEFARLLRTGGRLVLSTHHPTHDAKSLTDPGYMVEEVIEERWGWLDQNMRYYRRPLSSFTEPLADAGFVIERVCEPKPDEAFRQADPKGYEHLRRLPAFLFMRARKDT
jgi:SAM-dependent methyltransferase